MRAIVIGAGVSGLTAARDLSRAGHDVVVLEGSPIVGGKLRRRAVGGVVVDVGAEAMLFRRPEGAALATELGLPLVHPTSAGSRVWTRDALRPLPRTLMGAPLDLDQLAASGILSEAGLVRARHQFVTDVAGDISVGDLVAQRFGDEVVDRLVEPLLGGVYAGHARAISARAAAPALLSGVDLAAVPVSSAPVFAGLAGGMAGLTEALAAEVSVEVDTTVRELRRTASGFEVVSGPTTAPRVWSADAVVVAVPGAPAARLLSDVAPVAATELGAIDYASVVVVTLAFRTADLPSGLAAAAGFLIPPIDGRRIKASTFSFAKWDWVREAGGELALLRTSLGRAGEERTLQATDEELVTWSLDDLAAAVGIDALPVDSHVQRWGGGLPQYAVGHLDRVARIRSAVATVPGLAVCGAAYDGVGIPACIASAHEAATVVGTIAP